MSWLSGIGEVIGAGLGIWKLFGGGGNGAIHEPEDIERIRNNIRRSYQEKMSGIDPASPEGQQITQAFSFGWDANTLEDDINRQIKEAEAQADRLREQYFRKQREAEQAKSDNPGIAGDVVIASSESEVDKSSYLDKFIEGLKTGFAISQPTSQPTQTAVKQTEFVPISYEYGKKESTSKIPSYIWILGLLGLGIILIRR